MLVQYFGYASWGHSFFQMNSRIGALRQQCLFHGKLVIMGISLFFIYTCFT